MSSAKNAFSSPASYATMPSMSSSYGLSSSSMPISSSTSNRQTYAARGAMHIGGSSSSRPVTNQGGLFSNQPQRSSGLSGTTAMFSPPPPPMAPTNYASSATSYQPPTQFSQATNQLHGLMFDGQ